MNSLTGILKASKRPMSSKSLYDTCKSKSQGLTKHPLMYIRHKEKNGEKSIHSINHINVLPIEILTGNNRSNRY